MDSVTYATHSQDEGSYVRNKERIESAFALCRSEKQTKNADRAQLSHLRPTPSSSLANLPDLLGRQRVKNHRYKCFAACTPRPGLVPFRSFSFSVQLRYTDKAVNSCLLHTRPANPQRSVDTRRCRTLVVTANRKRAKGAAGN